jgi:hypothetical protein
LFQWAAFGVEKKAIINAKVPSGEWKGWGLYSEPNPEGSENLPVKEQFSVVKTPEGEPRSFSGRIAGLKDYEGAVIGLVSMVDVWWIDSDKYEWTPVRPDGTFAITAQRNPKSLKAICMRAPGHPWTFLRYNFKADEGGENIVLYAEPGKQVCISASVVGSTVPVTWLALEPFEAYTSFDDNGVKLTKQRYGRMTAQENELYVTLPLRKVALFITANGAATDYEIIDPRLADHFHFNLLKEGWLKLKLMKDGQAVPNQSVKLYNDAAPLSVRGHRTNAEGILETGSLIPGTYDVEMDKRSFRFEAKSGETTNVTYDLATGKME